MSQRILIFLLTLELGAEASEAVAAGLEQASGGTGAISSNCRDNPALGYLKLIEAMDWQGMHQRLAGNARYLDPTMAYYDRAAIDLSGPDAIVDFWRSSSEESGTSSIRYTYTHCFETAGFHVIRYEIAVEVAGEFWGLKQDRVVIPGQVTSVIHIANGRVTEHRDYVDYAGADRFIDALKAKEQR